MISFRKYTSTLILHIFILVQVLCLFFIHLLQNPFFETKLKFSSFQSGENNKISKNDTPIHLKYQFDD